MSSAGLLLRKHFYLILAAHNSNLRHIAVLVEYLNISALTLLSKVLGRETSRKCNSRVSDHEPKSMCLKDSSSQIMFSHKISLSNRPSFSELDD